LNSYELLKISACRADSTGNRALPFIARFRPLVEDAVRTPLTCDRLRAVMTVHLCGARLIRTVIAIGVVMATRSTTAAQVNQPFAIGSVSAARGSKASGMLTVDAGVDQGTFIPITIVHGATAGPVLALIAGVHGSEYSPILALQQVLPRLDAREIRGTVVLVHVANIPAFLGRTIYTGPIDGKNLNRSYPGKADGTISERIAHRITNDIIKRADYVVDIHSGDANEDLRPWTGYYARHGTPDVIARSREMAIAFGFDHIVMLPQTPKTPAEAIYTGATAVALGKPSFDVECGGLGAVDPDAFGRISDGVMSLLRHLRMLGAAAAPAARPIFIATRSSVASHHDGIFYRQVKAGEQVNAGAALGYITDFFGNRVAELRAPKAGVVLSVFGTPPVRKGETVAVIGHVDESSR
jgi:predicted deacylase